MMQWLRDYWMIVAFVLTVAVIPFLNWVVGQIRKGLASHEQLEKVKLDATERIANQAKASSDAVMALEMRLNNRFDVLAEWVAGHNVTHATMQGQMDQLRQAIDQLPKADQLTKLLLIAQELRGDIKAVQRSVDQIEERVARHETIFANAATQRKVPA